MFPENNHKPPAPAATETPPLRRYLVWQLVIFSSLMMLSLLNEGLDLPHLLLGAPANPAARRWEEAALECTFYLVAVGAQIWFIRRLCREIRILQGLLCLCANCKRIRSDGDWGAIESYLTSHSHATFTHSLCPDCVRKLYPELVSVLEEKGLMDTPGVTSAGDPAVGAMPSAQLLSPEVDSRQAAHQFGQSTQP